LLDACPFSGRSALQSSDGSHPAIGRAARRHPLSRDDPRGRWDRDRARRRRSAHTCPPAHVRGQALRVDGARVLRDGYAHPHRGRDVSARALARDAPAALPLRAAVQRPVSPLRTPLRRTLRGAPYRQRRLSCCCLLVRAAEPGQGGTMRSARGVAVGWARRFTGPWQLGPRSRRGDRRYTWRLCHDSAPSALRCWA
jgi:hypothetical protein